MFVSCVGLLSIVLSPLHYCSQHSILSKNRSTHYHSFHSRSRRIVDGVLTVAVVFCVIFDLIHSRHPDHLEYGKIATIDAVPAYRFFACKVEYRPHKQAVLLVDRLPLLSGLPAV